MATNSLAMPFPSVKESAQAYLTAIRILEQYGPVNIESLLLHAKMMPIMKTIIRDGYYYSDK